MVRFISSEVSDSIKVVTLDVWKWKWFNSVHLI